VRQKGTQKRPIGHSKIQKRNKKPHKNNAVRFTCVLAAGTTCWVIFPLKQSMLGLSSEKGNSKGVKKELFWVKNG
jgi:hypothetical protein